MQSIKEVIDELNQNKKVTIPRQFLEKVSYIMYKYYLEKEPDSEFITNYTKEFGNTFEFIKSSIYYIKYSFKIDVDIQDSNDTLLITKK